METEDEVRNRSREGWGEGLRTSPMMTPMAASVNEEEMINIAAYLAAQK